MGKTGKWIRNFLTGKKDKEKQRKTITYNLQPTSITIGHVPTTPITILPATPKEKKRWSFRRSSATATGPQDLNSTDMIPTTPPSQQALLESDNDQKIHAMAIAAATAAAVDAAAAAAKAAAAVIQLTAVASGRTFAFEEAAAIKIQSVFRSYLARKALNALKGLVKLQALVRGYLVRKQAKATLRCMQALITAQARARAQRIQIAQESKTKNSNQFNHRNSTQENRFRQSSQDFDEGMDENIKIVEMDTGDSKGRAKGRNSFSSSNGQTERMDHRISTSRASSKQEQISPSPSPSPITDLSPKACSGHFEEYSLGTAQSTPQYYSNISKPEPSIGEFAYAHSEYGDSLYHEYPFNPSYMANTESSRAKVRSHSAPKQRPESFERQPSRRRPSIEGRNVPRAVRMQRSASNVGSAPQNYHYPWSIKLDRSSISLKDSECGSTTSTILTNTNYCRSLVGFDVHGNKC